MERSGEPWTANHASHTLTLGGNPPITKIRSFVTALLTYIKALAALAIETAYLAWRRAWRAALSMLVLYQDRHRIHRLIRPLLRWIPQPQPRSRIDFFLRAYSRFQRNVFFIQIGANDGVTLDPFQRYLGTKDWAGIRVEPVPHLFEKLAKNSMGFPRVILENSAIADRDGELEFFSLPPMPESEKPPIWFDLVGSLSREMVEQSARLLPEPYRSVCSQKVQALTFESLCKKHQVNHMDVLYIDAEGHDYSILKQVDLKKYRPQVILFEQQHLTIDERSACFAHLQDCGYDFLIEWYDALCFRLDANSFADRLLLRLWGHLRPLKEI